MERAYWLIGELLVVRAGDEDTDGRMALVEHRAARGADVPWHRQPGDDETFHVLEGELDLWVDDPAAPPRTLRPGDTAVARRGVPHAFRVASAEARYLTVHTPAGHERFYAAAGEPAATATLPAVVPPDMPRLEAACAEHGVELLGPPPNG